MKGVGFGCRAVNWKRRRRGDGCAGRRIACKARHACDNLCMFASLVFSLNLLDIGRTIHYIVPLFPCNFQPEVVLWMQPRYFDQHQFAMLAFQQSNCKSARALYPYGMHTMRGELRGAIRSRMIRSAPTLIPPFGSQRSERIQWFRSIARLGCGMHGSLIRWDGTDPSIGYTYRTKCGYTISDLPGSCCGHALARDGQGCNWSKHSRRHGGRGELCGAPSEQADKRTCEQEHRKRCSFFVRNSFEISYLSFCRGFRSFFA
jgi:hypothetical protein